MTWDPAAGREPVDSHGGAMTAHLGLILHVTTNWADPGPFFAHAENRASSTWWVRKDGELEEFVDADLRAWAQAAGNSTYDSVETDGTPDVPLSAAQVETLAHLYAWGHQVYGWPFALAEQPGQRGLGWHGMGGDAWGGHPYCPGAARRNQRQHILDRAEQLATRDGGVQHPTALIDAKSGGLNALPGTQTTPGASAPADSSIGSEDVMTPAQEQKLDDLTALVRALHDEHKLIIHGDSSHGNNLDTIAKQVGVPQGPAAA